MTTTLRDIVARAMHRSHVVWTSEPDPWRGLSSIERKAYQRESYRVLRALGTDPATPVELQPASHPTSHQPTTPEREGEHE